MESRTPSISVPESGSQSTLPQLERARRLTGETLIDQQTAPLSTSSHALPTSPHITRSPRLMPSPQESPLAPIPELPPGVLGDSRPSFHTDRGPSKRPSSTAHGPVMDLLQSHDHQSHLGSARQVLEGTDTSGVSTPESRSSASPYSMGQGQRVTLLADGFPRYPDLRLTCLTEPLASEPLTN